MVAGPHAVAQSPAFTMTAFPPPQGSAVLGPDEQGVAVSSPLRRAADASVGSTASTSTIQLSQANADAGVAPPVFSLNQTAGAGGSTYSPKETYSTVGSGAALPVAVRNPLARSFGADLSPIRVHQDPQAQAMAKGLSTRAFTLQNHVYLGSGERPDDLGLMAHETAHALQQRGAPAAMQTFTSGRGDACETEAQQASSAVSRGESFTVQQTTAARPQGLLGIDIPDPLDWLANKANIIPGFRMLTIILGVNPINMSGVDRSAANILRAMIEFMPGGGLITEALDNAGIFEQAGAFVETQLASLGLVGSSIKAAVSAFIDGLSLRRIITDPGGVWESAKSIFTEPIDRIKAFAVGLVVGIVKLIKDAILKPIAKMAEGTEGYNLLKGILGKDPITGETVPRSAETLLGPMLKMIGLGDVWQKMQDAKAIPRCWAWFQSTMGQLLAIVSSIPSEFLAAFKSLTLEDIILVPKAFIKLGKVFVGFLGKFVSWGVNAMWELLKIVFDVVSPGAWGYIQRTGGALQSILKNPLPFVGNLVKAAKAGFQNFSGRFLTHLKNGLIDWLTGSLTGIYIPKALTLLEFGKMAISVLGLSWAQIRGKLVKALGPNGEWIMTGLEGAFDVVKALVTGGPAAAWEVLKDKLTSLKDTIVSGITSMVVEAVVTKAVPKFIAMFIPGAGFISAIISIYDIVMVFVEKISKIIQVVNSFISSIIAIAAGNIGAAAAKVESVLAGLLTLAINFLAGFAGLGKIASKVRGIVDKVRGTVDKALDAAIAFIIAKAKALFAYLFGKKKDGKPEKPKTPSELEDKAGQLVAARVSGNHTDEEIQTVVNQVKQELAPEGLKKLEFGPLNTEGEAPLIAEASPAKTVAKKKKPKSKSAAVVMSARILFKTAAMPEIERPRKLLGGQQAAPLTFGVQNIPQARSSAVPGETSGMQQGAIIGTPATGQHKSTTVLLQPAPGANEVKVMSWNTGEPKPGSASSHAERAFSEWFTPAIRTNVSTVHININLSPCSICSGGTLPDLKGSGITGTVTYQSAYEGYDKKTGIIIANTTTVEDLGALSGLGWSVNGPAPRWTNASKEKEKIAGHSILSRQG
jgi:hypothetical protein